MAGRKYAAGWVERTALQFGETEPDGPVKSELWCQGRAKAQQTKATRVEQEAARWRAQ